MYDCKAQGWGKLIEKRLKRIPAKQFFKFFVTIVLKAEIVSRLQVLFLANVKYFCKQERVNGNLSSK